MDKPALHVVLLYFQATPSNTSYQQPLSTIQPRIAGDVWSDMPGISQPARHEMLYLDSLERAQRLKVPKMMVFGPWIWEHWERIWRGSKMEIA